MRRFLVGPTARVAVFLLCLTPALLLSWRTYESDLGANPVETLTHVTGLWTLRMLLLTLSVTPLRRLLNFPDLIKYRRMLGLFAFFYGCCHFLVWAVFDHELNFADVSKDIAKRPFMLAGMTALTLMMPLAVTSTKGWIRRLGGKRWQRLHRLVYASAALGVAHFYWLVKSDVTRPVFYGVVLATLLGFRLWWQRTRPA